MLLSSLFWRTFLLSKWALVPLGHVPVPWLLAGDTGENLELESCRMHWERALGQGCGAGVHVGLVSMEWLSWMANPEALGGPTCAAPPSSGSRGSGVGCCSSAPSRCLSVLLSGSAGDMGLAVMSRWVCHWGMWGRAQGLPLHGSCQVEYMSCSSINYSNWLSEAVLVPILPLRGSMSSSSFDVLCAGESLSPPCHLSPAQRHVPMCLQGHGPCELPTHVGMCLSPTPNNMVVTAASSNVNASGRVWPRRGCSGAL